MNAMPSGERGVAYLVNRYPAPSHSFIRREILALEAQGWAVHRFAHRRSGASLVDPADVAESRCTQVLLDLPKRRLVASVAGWLAERPRATLATFALAVRMAWRSDRRFLAHLGYFALACALSRRLRELGSPHLHAHFGTNPAAVARLTQCIGGFSYSLTFHGPHEFEWPDRLGLDEKMSGAHFIAAVSSAGRKLLQQRYPRHAHKVLLIRCGLGASWWDRTPSPVPVSPRLACVARLDEQKDPLLLIDAIALVLSWGYAMELNVAGDGPLRAAVERRIEQLRLSSVVRLHGWCSEQQVVALLESSRALVLSSRGEGLPVAVMEAFACGRPAIAPDVGATRELVESGLSGWLVPAGDAHALAGAIRDCLQAPPEQMQALGSEARRRGEAYDVRESGHRLAARFPLRPKA